MISLSLRKKYLSFTIQIAFNTGKILMKYWGKLKEIQQKQYFSNLVTEADKGSEAYILKNIKREFPHHAILSEESGLHPIEDSEFMWVLDPLDGTTNFAHRFPFFSISIGLLYQGQPIVGVVYNPYFNEMFTAAIGIGAQRNKKKIQVSTEKKLKKSLLATGFAYDRQQNPENNYAQFCHLTSITHGVRRIGSAALDLAYVASGSLEGFWERGLQPWDMAAGIVLVTEAGGTVTDYDRKPINLESGRVLATNGLIHKELSRELK